MSTTELNATMVAIDPPGFVIEEVTKEPRGTICFPEKKSKSLLAPLVEARYSDDGTNRKLTISAVVFISTEELSKLSLKVYQNSYTNIEGIPQLQFFVSYDLKENEASEFDVYEITFDARNIPFNGGLAQIKTIETFLWDVDPVASRGTVTTVQSGG